MSRVELFVVAMIVGVLAAVLLPAVRAAQEFAPASTAPVEPDRPPERTGRVYLRGVSVVPPPGWTVNWASPDGSYTQWVPEPFGTSRLPASFAVRRQTLAEADSAGAEKQLLDLEGRKESALIVRRSGTGDEVGVTTVTIELADCPGHTVSVMISGGRFSAPDVSPRLLEYAATVRLENLSDPAEEARP